MIKPGNALFLDTNVLLSASTPARPLQRQALSALEDLPNRGVLLCTSGQVLREYLAVATRTLDENGLQLKPEAALDNVDAFRARMRLLEENVTVLDALETLLRETSCSGKRVHDANVVATMIAHGVEQLLTANVADFRRFAARVKVVDLASLPLPPAGRDPRR